jgi:hypothetical protein
MGKYSKSDSLDVPLSKRTSITLWLKADDFRKLKLLAAERKLYAGEFARHLIEGALARCKEPAAQSAVSTAGKKKLAD